MDRISLLKKVNLFSGLNETEIESIAGYCVERSFNEGEMILRQGISGVGLYIIISGKVKIVKRTSTGENVDMAELGPGDFFGEMTVLDNAPRSASVVAVQNSKCFVLSAWDFKARMALHPEIALKILPVVVKRFRETNDMLLTLSPRP